MREISNAITLYHLADIESIQDGRPVLKQGTHPAQLEATSEITLEPKVQNNDAGTLYNIQEEISIDQTPTDIRNRYRTLQPVIARFLLTDLSELWIGTREIPARVSITGHLQRDQLILEAKCLSSPF